MWYFGIFLGLLVLVAAALHRIRLVRAIAADDPALTDEHVRQIEAAGHVDFDEPLDHEQIQEEEARFWDEHPWEESEEW